MTVIIKDRVKQTATAIVATGDLSLVGTPSGYVSFASALNSGEQVYYCVENGSAFEVGIGTYGASGANTFRRDTVLNSSTGSRLSVSGRATVFITVPASKFPFVTESGELSLALSTLNDVTLTAPASGESLKYNGSAWINEVVSGYTTEEAQDAIGGILVDTSSISFSYNDGVPSISASVRNSGITNDMLATGIDVAKLGSGNVSSIELGYLDGVTSSLQVQLDSKYSNANPSGYISASLASGTYVPYSGATGGVNLGTYALTCGAITASGLLSLQNSTTPMEFNLHNTFTSATSREYLKMLAVTGGSYQIGSAIGSAGGTTRSTAIGSWNSGGTFSSVLQVNPAVAGVSNPTISVATDGSFSWASKVLMGPYDGGNIFYWYAYSGLSSYAFLNNDPYPSSTVGYTSLKIDASSACKHAFNLPYGTTSPASLYVGTNSASHLVFAVRGFSGQSANLTEWQNSSGVLLASVSSSGGLLTPDLIVRNGTTATQFDLTNTYTSATSFEVLRSKANAGAAYQIGSAIGSAGGSNRAIQIGHWNSAGSFTSSFSVNTTANQVQIGTIVAGYNTSYSTNIYGVNLNNATPHCTIWSGDGSAFGSSFSGYNVFMVGHDIGTLSGYGIGAYSKFVYSNGSTLSIPQICVGNPSGFSGLDLALGTTGTPSDGEYTVTSGYGTNKAGASLWLMAGRSTGTGAGGSVYIGTSNTGSSGATRNTNLTLAQFNSTAITFSRDLLFTDATYDIGKSGATRPRDGFFSRNLTVGGTVNVGNSSIYDVDSNTAAYYHLGNRVWDHYGSSFRVFGNIVVGNTGGIGFTSTTTPSGSYPDIYLTSTVSGVLEQRNSTNAQTFRLAETWTSSTSFGVLQFKANAGAAYQIGSAIGSAGGTNRDLSFGQWNSAGTFSNLLNISGASGGSTVRIATTSGTGTCGLEFGSTLSGWQMGQIKVSYDSLGGWGTGFDFVINAGSGPSHLATLFSISSRGRFVFTQLADASGSPTAFTLTGAAHTTLTASTESTDVDFNLARTVQFATGALTTQRAMRIQAPTYSFVGASTVTTASTLSISGAPTAGTNATITNAYALNVESGVSNFVGTVRVNGIAVNPTTTSPTIYANNTFNSVGFWCSGDSVGTCYGSGVFMNYVHTNPGATCSFGYNTDIVLGTDITYAKLRWGSSLSIGLDAANVLAQRNGTNAQEFRIYTTYTSTTSYERLEIKGKSGANFEIGAENGSAGGTLRGITIGGYSAGSSTITPWITLTNTGAATFTISNSEVASIATGSVNLTSDTNMIFRLYAHGEISSGGIIQSYKARGADRNTKLYPAGSDNLIGFNVYGWDESSNNWSGAKATWSVSAPSTWTATSNGTQHTWTTTDAADATKTLTNRMRLQSNGNLTLGGITDTGGLFQIIGTNNAVTGFGTATNRLRFTDTDTTTATDQPIGEIEFYSSDASSPGAGVKASFLCAAESATPSACFKWGIDTTTGSLTNVMTLASSGLLTVTGGIVSSKVIRQNSEITYTPTGTTQTLTLNDGNHLTLNLTSATGTVTATLTVPTSSSSGTIIINQHASAAKGITWAVSSGTIKWMGTQPTWSSDAVSSVRIVSWRWNGSIMYLMSTDVGT